VPKARRQLHLSLSGARAVGPTPRGA